MRPALQIGRSQSLGPTFVRPQTSVPPTRKAGHQPRDTDWADYMITLAGQNVGRGIPITDRALGRNQRHGVRQHRVKNLGEGEQRNPQRPLAIPRLHEADQGHAGAEVKLLGRFHGVRNSSLFRKWWLGPELNRRHADFQSAALPTELPSQRKGHNRTNRLTLWQGGFLRVGFARRRAQLRPSLDALDLRPLAGLRGTQDGIDDVIGGETVLEVGFGALAGFEALEEFMDLVDEAVFVTDLQAGHPPVLHVRMIAVADVDAAPAAHAAFDAVVET